MPKSKIVVIGGTDDLCRSAYECESINSVLHLDSMIDVKPKFKLQLQDKNKAGELLFPPSFNEDHHSYLREVVKKDSPMPIPKHLTFYGLHGHKVSKEDINLVKESSADSVQLFFYQRDIIGKKVTLDNVLKTKEKEEEKAAVCLDLSCFKAEFAPGISEPNPVYGFSPEMMKECLAAIAKKRQDDLIMITEFNPAIEKFETAKTLCHMFEHLLTLWSE